MLQVNLLPWREGRRQRRLNNLLCITFVSIVLIAVFMTSWRWGLHNDIAIQKRELAALVFQQRGLTQQQNRVDKAEAALLVAQQRRERSQQRYLRSLGYLSLLQSVSRAIPDEVWLTQLSEHHGKVTLSGQSLDYPQLLAFGQHLKSFGLLASLVFKEVSQLPTQRLHFVMQATLNEQGRSSRDESAVSSFATEKERFDARILSP